MDTELVLGFEQYANSHQRGYLKYYKAVSILSQLRQIPAVMEDEVRFLSYLKSCLTMEGFGNLEIELIMGWLYERKLLIEP